VDYGRCVIDRFPDLDPARIVHEDDALIFVDKPSGVPSQAARPEDEDDLPTRLRRFLAARDGGEVYIGTHQRLDRATSGVLVYTKKRGANRSVAEQLEGRSVVKTYVAAVRGFRGGDRTLRHRLGPLEDGRVQVVPARDRRGQDAETIVRVRARNGDRALLELQLVTGRTHQARVQLAAEGAPIAGDRVYGDVPAERLLLHAESLQLREATARAPLPRAFHRWLEHGARSPLTPFDREAVDDALFHARDERYGLGRSNDTNAFRLLNEGGDALEGVSIDVYGDHLVVSLYDDAAVSAQQALLDAIEALGFAGIYLKLRPKQANVLVDARNETIAPSRPVRGAAAPDEFEVRELGLPYLVRLGDGLSTGIFLDQRENRRRIRELSAGKRVLNLFAYTCPFTIAAAAGGAVRTVSVDAARPAIERGERGLAHAGFTGDHSFVVDDVFAWLERARKKERFDVVILDPPSYSTVGKQRFSTASGDYRKLAALAMSVVAPKGLLLACSNHRQTVQAKLRRLLHEAAREANRGVAQMKDLPVPADFPAPFGREPHLKSILLRFE
jgi:23S rRNA (cytosine1962-C5)-methyltransferase